MRMLDANAEVVPPHSHLAVGGRSGQLVPNYASIHVCLRSPRMQSMEWLRQEGRDALHRAYGRLGLPAKANALLSRYEELPQYDKGTLERSIRLLDTKNAPESFC